MHKLFIDWIEENTEWCVTCESPLEILHLDGSLATGRAAEMVIDSFPNPKIEVRWYHPVLGIHCTEATHKGDTNGYRETVLETIEIDENGVLRGTWKEYYDLPKVGDYWITNGHWWGRREEGGFRVLATHALLTYDPSLWERKEKLVLNKIDDSFYEFLDDDIPF